MKSPVEPKRVGVAARTIIVVVILLLCAVRPTLADNLESDRSNSISGQSASSALSTQLPGPLPTPFTQRIIKASPEVLLTSAGLDSAIAMNMALYNVPGLSACIVAGDDIVWTGSYGYADAALTIPVTDTTLFKLASISKTILTTAVLQLWEDGLLDLDADINHYLPFMVKNPYYPDDAITARMILAHTSSIARRDETWVGDIVFGADHPTPLAQYLADYLDPAGMNYLPINYLNVLPGSTGQYSNYAFSVLAVVVESITGLSLEQYCQDAVFGPLGMNEASWFLANLDVNNIAMPLRYTGGGTFWEYGHPGSPIYPAGQVRTSAPQLARHLSSFIGYGRLVGARPGLIFAMGMFCC